MAEIPEPDKAWIAGTIDVAKEIADFPDADVRQMLNQNFVTPYRLEQLWKVAFSIVSELRPKHGWRGSSGLLICRFER